MWKSQEIKNESVTLVLIGDYAVGKTSILERITKNKFNPDSPTTIGIDFSLIHLPINHQLVKVRMWDTAGMERFRSIIQCYFKNIDGILMVCDCLNIQSIKNLKEVWIDFIKNSSTYTEDSKFYVIVNKWDTSNSMFTQYGYNDESRKDFLRNFIEIEYENIYFVSAKTSDHVHEMIMDITKDILHKRKNKKVISSLHIEEGWGALVSENPKINREICCGDCNIS